MTAEPARDEGYAIVPRWIMKDQRFTIHMVMVYLALQSFSGVTGSVFPSLATLAKRARLAPSTTRNTLRALEAIGVVETEQRMKDGVFTSSRYVLLTHDPNEPALSDAEGVHRDTVGVHRSTVGGTPGDGAEVTPSKNKDTYTPEALIEPPQPADDNWTVFWEKYPRKVGKEKALAAWKRAIQETSPYVILEGLSRHLPSLLATEAQFRLHPATWLNQKFWAEDPEPVPSSTSRGGTKQQPNIPTQDEWMYR